MDFYSLFYAYKKLRSVNLNFSWNKWGSGGTWQQRCNLCISTIYTSEILLTPPPESELMFFRYCNLLYMCHSSCLEAISLCIIQSVHFNGKDIQQQPYRIRPKGLSRVYLGPGRWFLFYINTMYVILPCPFPQDYHCPPNVSPTPSQKWWREWVLVQWLSLMVSCLRGSVESWKINLSVVLSQLKSHLRITMG